MNQIYLNGKKAPVTNPEQVGQFVAKHPAIVRRYVYVDELKEGYKALRAEWTEAARANPDPEVPELVRLLLADVATLLGLE